jgi:hypothetical protein
MAMRQRAKKLHFTQDRNTKGETHRQIYATCHTSFLTRGKSLWRVTTLRMKWLSSNLRTVTKTTCQNEKRFIRRNDLELNRWPKRIRKCHCKLVQLVWYTRAILRGPGPIQTRGSHSTISTVTTVQGQIDLVQLLALLPSASVRRTVDPSRQCSPPISWA